MRPAVLWIVPATAALLASAALAAPLFLTPASLGTGNASITPCDADGFTHTYTTSRGNVTAVTIGGLADPACEGGSVRVTVTSSTGASIASGGPQPVPTDGDTVDNSVTLAAATQPSAGQVAGLHVVVEGP